MAIHYVSSEVLIIELMINPGSDNRQTAVDSVLQKNWDGKMVYINFLRSKHFSGYTIMWNDQSIFHFWNPKTFRTGIVEVQYDQKDLQTRQANIWSTLSAGFSLVSF